MQPTLQLTLLHAHTPWHHLHFVVSMRLTTDSTQYYCRKQALACHQQGTNEHRNQLLMQTCQAR